MKKIRVIGAIICVCLFWVFKFYESKTPKKSTRPERVVALAPSYCETLVSLRLEHLLVGVSNYCEGEKYAKIPKIGSFQDPNFEAIIALKPDLVLAVAHPMVKNLLELLEAQGIEVIAKNPDSLKEIYEITMLVAEKFNVKKQGERVVSDLKLSLEKARGKRSQEKTFLIAFSPSPLVVAGKNSYPSEVFEAMGFKNMAEKNIAWASWPLESLIKNPPDILLLADGHENQRLYEDLFLKLKVKPNFIAPKRAIFSSPSPKLTDDINYINLFIQNL